MRNKDKDKWEYLKQRHKSANGDVKAQIEEKQDHGDMKRPEFLTHTRKYNEFV